MCHWERFIFKLTYQLLKICLNYLLLIQDSAPQRKRKRHRTSILWFIPYSMQNKQGWSMLTPGTRNFSRISHMVNSTPSNWVIFLSTFAGHQREARLDVKQPGLKPASIWDASSKGGGLIHYATLLTPLEYFLSIFYESYFKRLFTRKPFLINICVLRTFLNSMQ